MKFIKSSLLWLLIFGTNIIGNTLASNLVYIPLSAILLNFYFQRTLTQHLLNFSLILLLLFVQPLLLLPIAMTSSALIIASLLIPSNFLKYIEILSKVGLGLMGLAGYITLTPLSFLSSLALVGLATTELCFKYVYNHFSLTSLFNNLSSSSDSTPITSSLQPRVAVNNPNEQFHRTFVESSNPEVQLGRPVDFIPRL